MSYWSSYDDDTSVCGFVALRFVIGGNFVASDPRHLLSINKATTMATIIIVTDAAATDIKAIVIIFKIEMRSNAVVNDQMASFVIIVALLGYSNQLI